MNFSVTVYLGKVTVAEGLHVSMARKEIGFVGLVFGLLAREQHDTVHVFVLKEQKRLADLRRTDKYDVAE